jgi:DNA-directed RNA polymerase specialized sigma24 family protein
MTSVDIEELYDAHAPRLYALALRITGDRDAAAAALEDAFLRFWESADASGGDSFSILVRLTRERALARRQGQSTPSDVGTMTATPASLVEELFFGGVSLRDLAGRHGLGESQVRGMIREGMAALRVRVAQQE